jgi:uncharacterized membrane protein
MQEISQSITIDAPVKEVFDYVSSYRNWPEFYVGISDVKPITDNVKSTGSKFIYKVKVMGINFSVGTEFRDFRENEGWKGKSFKGVEHETNWIFKDFEGKTLFNHGISYHIPWYMGGIIYEKFIGNKAWVKIIEKSLENLKRIMETN